MFPKDNSLTELEEIEDNKEYLRLLIEQINSPIGIIPFVGAGLSIPFGFPSWGSFLTNQAKKAGIEEKINKRLEEGEYEEAAQDLLEARRYRAFHDAISNTFGRHHLKGKKLKGPVTLLPILASGPVITTNFDHVLEKIFEQAGNPFEREIWGANAAMAHQAIVKNKRFLLKIHGDAEDSSSRILTKSDYAKHYCGHDGSSIDFKLPLPGLLHRMLLGKALLFLGCSLNMDRTIGVLHKVSTNNPEIAHYAIVEHPIPKEHFHERSRFLSDHNIRPIWYPNGRHDLIEPLLAYLLTKPDPARASLDDRAVEVSAKDAHTPGGASIGGGVSTLSEDFHMKKAIAIFCEELVFPNECDEVAEYLASRLEILDQGSNLLHKRYALKPRIEMLIDRIEDYRNDHPRSSRDEKNDILKELVDLAEELASLE